MSHMTSLGSTCSDSGGACSSRVVTYTGTGAEGTSFMVSIGATLASSAYNVFFSPAGVTNVPVLDLPSSGRTTSAFPVATATTLTAGDVLMFLLIEGTATAVSTVSNVSAGSLVLILGDSNGLGQGDTANLQDGPAIAAPFAAVSYNEGGVTKSLQPRQPPGVPGMSIELTLGRELYWSGAAPVIGKLGTPGYKVPDWIASLSTITSFVNALAAETGTTLGSVVIMLVTNDGNNPIDAAAYAANLTSLVASLRAAYGLISVALVETPSASISEYANIVTVRAQALTFIAADPLAALVKSDDLTLQDALHYNADSLAVLGQRAAYCVFDLAGRTRLVPAGPSPDYVGSGIATGANGALTPHPWPGSVDGDLELLVVSTGHADVAPELTDAQGFIEVAGAAASSDYVGLKQRTNVWSRTVTQATLLANGGLMPAPIVARTTDYDAAKIFTIRGPAAAVQINAVNSSVNNAYSPTLSLAGVTTTLANCRILMFTTGYSANADNTATASNGGLSSVSTAIASTMHIVSDYRVIALCTGVKAAAAASGTSTITMAYSAVLAGSTIAVSS